MAYNFDNIEVTYHSLSRTTFVTGKKFEFEKKDKVSASRAKDGFLFTMYGSSDEEVRGSSVEGMYQPVIDYGRALYPIKVKVSNEGVMLGVDNIEEVRKQWREKADEIDASYGYSPVTMTMARQYESVLNDDTFFTETLPDNLMYRFLFWDEKRIGDPIVISNFPSPYRMASYFMERKGGEGNTAHYEEKKVTDEGSGNLVSGEARLDFVYAPDGLPQEIKLWVKMEEKDTGYFFHEMIMNRI